MLRRESASSAPSRASELVVEASRRLRVCISAQTHAASHPARQGDVRRRDQPLSRSMPSTKCLCGIARSTGLDVIICQGTMHAAVTGRRRSKPYQPGRQSVPPFAGAALICGQCRPSSSVNRFSCDPREGGVALFEYAFSFCLERV